jgi:hypothetical protein
MAPRVKIRDDKRPRSSNGSGVPGKVVVGPNPKAKFKPRDRKKDEPRVIEVVNKEVHGKIIPVKVFEPWSCHNPCIFNRYSALPNTYHQFKTDLLKAKIT